MSNMKRSRISRVWQWVMLTSKLPTIPSPPKMSFHLATPWIDEKALASQQKRFQPSSWNKVGCSEPDFEYDKDEPSLYGFFGAEDNASFDIAIHFEGEKIRVKANEYSATPDSMVELLNEDALIFHENANPVNVKQPRTGTAKREIMDAALLDGCNEIQAIMVADGVDPSAGEVAPTGWYELHRAYAEMFCTEREMSITSCKDTALCQR